MRKLFLLLLALCALAACRQARINETEETRTELKKDVLRQALPPGLAPGTVLDFPELRLRLEILDDSTVYAVQHQQVKTLTKTVAMPVKIKTVHKDKSTAKDKSQVNSKDKSEVLVKDKSENDNSQGKTVTETKKPLFGFYCFIIVAIIGLAVYLYVCYLNY